MDFLGAAAGLPDNTSSVETRGQGALAPVLFCNAVSNDTNLMLEY